MLILTRRVGESLLGVAVTNRAERRKELARKTSWCRVGSIGSM
jgi:hypothetical protein